MQLCPFNIESAQECVHVLCAYRVLESRSDWCCSPIRLARWTWFSSPARTLVLAVNKLTVAPCSVVLHRPTGRLFDWTRENGSSSTARALMCTITANDNRQLVGNWAKRSKSSKLSPFDLASSHLAVYDCAVEQCTSPVVASSMPITSVFASSKAGYDNHREPVPVPSWRFIFPSALQLPIFCSFLPSLFAQNQIIT